MPILFLPDLGGRRGRPVGEDLGAGAVVAEPDGDPARDGEEEQGRDAHRQDARGADAIGLGPGGRMVALFAHCWGS